MSATTLAIVNAPTLMDGMAELLRIGDALHAAQLFGDGVTIQRHSDGHLIAAEADPEVPTGVLVTEERHEVPDPWDSSLDERAAIELREVLEVLAQVCPTHDLLATRSGVQLL